MKSNNYSTGNFTSGLEGLLDPILTTGSLWLVDAAKSWRSTSAPVHGSVIGNLAWKQAAALLGSGTESSLAGSMAITAGADEVLMQVTGKGGLHGISSQLNQEQLDNIYINAPQVIRDYLMGRLTLDSLFISCWGRITRQAADTRPEIMQFGTAASAGTNYSMKFGSAANFPSTPGRGPVLSGSYQQLGNYIRNISRTTFTGTAPSTANALALRILFGSLEAVWTNKAPSHILYRWYVENLAVSGRTYAEVDALDYALYTQEVLTSGGRYYGDTFNDPATTLP